MSRESKIYVGPNWLREELGPEEPACAGRSPEREAVRKMVAREAKRSGRWVLLWLVAACLGAAAWLGWLIWKGLR